MMLIFRSLVVSLFLLILVGCASVTRGTKEVFVIETDPSGAMARSSDGWQCTTPCSMSVKRRGGFVVTITKDGYETVSSTINSSVDTAGGAAMAGNVIIGGLVGAAVDGMTGSMHSHKPNPLVVKMEKSED